MNDAPQMQSRPRWVLRGLTVTVTAAVAIGSFALLGRDLYWALRDGSWGNAGVSGVNLVVIVVGAVYACWSCAVSDEDAMMMGGAWLAIAGTLLGGIGFVVCGDLTVFIALVIVALPIVLAGFWLMFRGWRDRRALQRASLSPCQGERDRG